MPDIRSRRLEPCESAVTFRRTAQSASRRSPASGLAHSTTVLAARPIRRHVPPSLACHTSPPKAKRVIYLFQSGAPSQLDLFDHKPRAARTVRGRTCPTPIRKGQRLTGMTATQERFPVAPSQVQLRAARQVRRLGQRAAAAHGQGRRRPVLHQVDAHRGDQPRPGDHVLPDRRAARRPAEHRRVARYGLGSENRDLPAFVVLISQGSRQPGRSAALRSPVGQRLSAVAATRA